ncbi:MAG: hypothetical protein JST50_05325 [Bacteroidetes bacterium]|jgi:hypothetical protein|nr:hypothetical protein [Bacteroidota bacterium]
MKKTLSLFTLIITAFTAHAQLYKMFVDENGKRVDSAKALSYIVWHQVSDTSWLMQQYDKHGTILQAGTFKDKALSIPHGKFIYYSRFNTYKIKLKPARNMEDTSNFLRTYGEFKNGKREGWWIDYFRDGKKQTVQYYRNDVLDGPYEAYNNDPNKVFAAGKYVDDKREGEWYMFSPSGDTIQHDTYYHGRVVESHQSMKAFHSATPPANFIALIEKRASRLISSTDSVSVMVNFDVTDEGKLINPKLMRPTRDKSFDAKLIDVFNASDQWTPASAGNPLKPVKDFSAVRLVIKNGDAEASLIDYHGTKERYYNLTH